MKTPRTFLAFVLALLSCGPLSAQSTQSKSASGAHAIVLHAARLLDVESGSITSPGEILIKGDSIAEVGTKERGRGKPRSSILETQLFSHG